MSTTFPDFRSPATLDAHIRQTMDFYRPRCVDASGGFFHFYRDDGSIYAVWPNGTPKWAYKTGGPVSASPAVTVDGSVFVGSQDGTIYGLGPDGKVFWSHPTAGAIHASPAIGPSGEIVIGSRDRRIYAFR